MLEKGKRRDRSARRILYLQYTNPAGYPPLEHSSRILANGGWHVLFLGTRALGADALRFPPHERIEIRQMSFTPAGWRQKLHFVGFSLWVLGWTARRRPKWVYASDHLTCPLAWLLSLLPGVSVIYHEHDSPSSSNGSFFQRMSLVARRTLAQRAKMCVLPNQGRADRFLAEVCNRTRKGPESTVVVWNCPSLEELSSPRAAHNGGGLWVLYHGSIVPARLPLTVLQALALLPDHVRLRIVGYETVGHRGYVRELQEYANRFGIGRRVKIADAVPRTNLLHWCRECDVGLAFMPKASKDINQEFMIGASNKPFDYLCCGLAVLVSDLPDWHRMYVDPGYGLACNPEDPQSVSSAIRWFLEHPDEMRVMGEKGRRRIAHEWNYETQFAPVLRHLNHGNAQ